MDGPHASRLVGRSGDGKSGGPGGWQSAQGAAALPDLWRGAARTRQASAQADHPWGANDPAYAQLRVLSHLSGGLFSRLYEELGLRAKVAFPPRLEESMVRLSTWMPFRPASRELAFFTGVQVAEATLGGEWKEVKTVALGVVNEPVEERGAQVVHSRELTYFSRTGGSGQFQQAALGEIHARGVEKAETVCEVSDGADWILKFVDYHRQDAVRIQDAGSCHGVCGASGPSHPRAVALPRGTHHHAGAHQVQTGLVPAVAEAPTTRIENRRGKQGARRTEPVPNPDAGASRRVSSGDDHQEAGLCARTASDADVCDLSGAGLSHWEWECGECQQTRGAKPHERSRDALVPSACQRHARAAQSGL